MPLFMLRYAIPRYKCHGQVRDLRYNVLSTSTLGVVAEMLEAFNRRVNVDERKRRGRVLGMVNLICLQNSLSSLDVSSY